MRNPDMENGAVHLPGLPVGPYSVGGIYPSSVFSLVGNAVWVFITYNSVYSNGIRLRTRSERQSRNVIQRGIKS